MLPVVLLMLTPAGGIGDTLRGTKPVLPALVNPDALTGFLYDPAYSLDKRPRGDAKPYAPAPGDVLCLSNPTPLFTFLYGLALTGKPSHGGLVLRLPDGQLGLLEAGWNDTAFTRVSPLEWRINHYPGTVWVRQRTTPINETESARLTEFAMLSANMKYNSLKFMSQITPFRCRGPIRTFFVGKPVGPGRKYFCAQALVEALVYANLVDAHTARPAAVYPEDLFFDTSRNLYLRLHPPLANGRWAPPALWTKGATGPRVSVPYADFMRPGVYVP